MKRSNRVLALSSLVLTLAFSAGCISTADSDDPDLAGPPAQPLAGHCTSPTPVSSVTPLPDGSFRFVSTAVLCASQGDVWNTIKDIEEVVAIALPGIASDFVWLDGGSAKQVPSDFQFNALGSLVHEQVFYRSHADHVLGYQLVEPALGIQSYVATMDVDEGSYGQSQLSFARTMRFDDPAVVPDFAALFEQEIASLQAHFAK
jgi:hypothetical protein